MILKGAKVYGGNFEPVYTDIKIENGLISDIGDSLSGQDITDMSGLTLMPGFIDIHIHGSNGADMSDGTVQALETMSGYLASKGVCSFCPATMTLPRDVIRKSFEAVREYKGRESGAYIHGVNMEGPFICEAKKGAQPAEYIRLPDTDEFDEMRAISEISLVDVAPEVENAFSFAGYASKFCTVSVAHTDADFPTAEKALKSGFSHATHLYSAMPPIENRAPGPVTAFFDHDSATAELICDGIHAHAPILRMSFKLLGEDRAVVVSDAMKAAGLGDGVYELGGQPVFVRNGRASLESGNLAGSTTNIYDEFKNLIRFSIPFKSVLKACTINPARVIGKDKITGSIEIGKCADIIAVDENMDIKAVIIKGKTVINRWE